jgi:cytochrome oxidase Cu insertion factor (SCO1/SenC/PrrC family)
MPDRRVRVSTWPLALLLLGVAALSCADEPHCPRCPPALSAAATATRHEHDAQQPEGSSLDLSIPDVAVTTQDGRDVRFYSGLVQGRVVVVNFIFTSCTTICPPLGASFGKLQTLLGPRLGRDVQLLSVSVDPATDTPAKLKAWAAQFHAGPGWTLVTGRKPEIDRLLKALNADSGRPQDHTPMLWIGNDSRRSWRRAFGLSPASALMKEIDAVLGSAVAATASVAR